MQKRIIVSFVFLSLMTTLFTFGLTGGVASALSITSARHARAVVSTSAAIPLATGGCAEHSGGPNNSFEMGVCISDRGTDGTIIYPDVYVNQAPLGPWVCTLYIELWDGGNKLFQDAGHNCVTGHYDSTKVLVTAGSGCTDPLHTSVWILFESVFYRIGDSPSYQFCS